MPKWKPPVTNDRSETWTWIDDDGHVLATVSREEDRWVVKSTAAHGLDGRGRVGEASSRREATACYSSCRGAEMGLSEAKRVLQWEVVKQALLDANVDQEVLDLVERARHVSDVVQGMTGVLLGVADGTKPKNYVKIEMVGLAAPFERAYVERVRPGGSTSHEIRMLLRDRLVHVRRGLVEEPLHEALVISLVRGIDEDLAKEAP
jgi:hypothetical protein